MWGVLTGGRDHPKKQQQQQLPSTKTPTGVPAMQSRAVVSSRCTATSGPAPARPRQHLVLLSTCIVCGCGAGPWLVVHATWRWVAGLCIGVSKRCILAHPHSGTPSHNTPRCRGGVEQGVAVPCALPPGARVFAGHVQAFGGWHGI